MANEVNDTICIPMKLDAFVLNASVCDGANSSAKIAPITQPNYTFLRLHDALIQNDILPHTDIHNTFDQRYNSRITNLDTGAKYLHRQGVYLHWMLPRIYRAGVAATEEVTLDHEQHGLPDAHDGSKEDPTIPQFRPVPSRWLIIRRIHKSVPDFNQLRIPLYKAWVLESDHQQKVDDVSDDKDLQIDVSPFIAAPVGQEVNIQEQAEIFVGKKTPVDSWTESDHPDEARKNVPLTILNGGNILFPDFQPHNSNVFSVLDNFEYKHENKTAYLESVTADYYVIGWHARPSEDPYFINSRTKRETRLGNYQMTLDPASKDAAHWKEKMESAHTVCHGAMYNVKWNVHEKPKTVPADKLCEGLQKAMPVAVGTTPLDSLVAYVRAHQKDEDDEEIKKVMQAIDSIQKYLLVQEDTVDGQEQADDLLYSYNYDAAPGGKYFHLASGTNPEQPTEKPNPEIVGHLTSLNREQVRLDSLDRAEQRVRWKVFARWWRYVSRGSSSDKEGQEQKDKCKGEVSEIMTEWETLRNSRAACERERDDLAHGKNLGHLVENKSIDISVKPSFHTQRDPTFLVGNIQSAWPHDWLDALHVRLNTDITTWKERDLGDTVRDGVGILKLPSNIQETAKALVKEFIALQSDHDGSQGLHPHTFKPLYHDDAKTGHTARRDQWSDTQPFFPLFLEWEAEYAHIDFGLWSLEERSSSDQGSAKLSYGIADSHPLYEKWQLKSRKNQNLRMLSGRVLVLPQPSFSLRSQVQQVFDQTPVGKLDEDLEALHTNRGEVLQNLDKLTYLSSPLAGFHDHLLTMAQGTHIKPTIRYGGGMLKAIHGAIDGKAGFSETMFRDNVFQVMGGETDLTPYGHLVHLRNDTGDSPFKPVTHGQFKITKLNIIDKFGQVIHALDPRWDAKPQYLRPCLSQYYGPQSLSDGTPNVVEQQIPGIKGSLFAQLPPHINQWARINSEFVELNPQGNWVPQDEWQDPIWGWMVYNYLDYAIQFFTKDGTFYREVSIGGESGTRKSEKWLPFKNLQDKKDGLVKLRQLDHLINSLSDPDVPGSKERLEAFISMIHSSMDFAASAPDAYAQFLNSIIGRPLALVNMAWSLELATDEYKNQSTINIDLPVRSLLDGRSSSTGDSYELPFKIGDEKRSYDGLVGYFKTLEPEKQSPDSYLDLKQCFTYFGVKKDAPQDAPLVEIQPANFPKLEPYYIDPVKHGAAAIETQRNAMLAKNTVGAIINPFVPVHAYTGLLPIQPLKLPTWTWQEAMNKMTAFFHIGPLHVTKDVPDFNGDLKLTTKTNLKDPGQIVDNGVGLPAMGSADWAWLQPYCDRNEKGDEETSFMPLGLAGTETKPRFEEGPYTTVEGYLQLRQPIVRALEKKKE